MPSGLTPKSRGSMAFWGGWIAVNSRFLTLGAQRMDAVQAIDEAALRRARIELAATCRWAARLGFQSGVCNHFSVVEPGRPELMLINP